MKIVKRTTRYLKSYNERTGEVKEGVEQEEIFYEPSEDDEYEALPDEQPRVYLEEGNSKSLEDDGEFGSANNLETDCCLYVALAFLGVILLLLAAIYRKIWLVLIIAVVVFLVRQRSKSK